MNIQDISREISALTGNLNIWLAISIFFLFFMSEFGISIPYLSESIWILVGFNARNLSFSVFEIVILLLMAISARICGATTFYSLSGLGRDWIIRIYQRFFRFVFTTEGVKSNSIPARILRRLNFFSPYAVAFGRLIWLKVPITLTMSMKKNLRVLLVGVALSSIVWDLVYILIGVIVGKAQLQPYQTVLYTLAALTIIYSGIYAGRRLVYSGHYGLAGGKEK